MQHLSSTELDPNQPDLELVKSSNSSDQVNAFLDPIVERNYQDCSDEGFSQSLHVFGGRFTNDSFFEI